MNTPDPPRSDRVDPAVWRMAVTLIVGALAVVLDTTIVSVALDDLTKDLAAPLSTVQWVGTGYLLAVFVTVPVAGWAQARFGGRRLWIAALGGFLLGSLLSALAWDAPSLIAFRVLQGGAAGILMPLMATLLVQAAGGRAIGKVMAIITVPTALGPILGPVLGGLILHLADWRWLFLVNLPFCAVGAWLARRNLPDDRPGPDRPGAPLDTIGLLLLSPGCAALVYGLSRVEGSASLTDAAVLAPTAVGLALVGGFVARAPRRAGAPLVDVRLLRRRAVASSAGLLFLGGVSLYGSMMLLPLYFQQVRGTDALGAGLLLVPQGVGALLARGLAGRYTDRVGPRGVATGAFVLVGVTTVPFALVTAGTATWLLPAALFVRGLALGAAMIAPMGAAYIGLERAEVPDASMITRLAQQLGGSVGIALLTVVLQHGTAGTRTPAALAEGFGTAFGWAVLLTVAAVPLCLLLPGRPVPADGDAGTGTGAGTGDTPDTATGTDGAGAAAAASSTAEV
ncbi:MDR family MFS transporter [Kitasatospora sp. NPDC094019]|uniref:MDR family MFS transporter n=1 Tax=Kitasatospora sp. NPDC094019 TaxID=3364091 RepID=UPI0038082CCD